MNLNDYEFASEVLSNISDDIEKNIGLFIENNNICSKTRIEYIGEKILVRFDDSKYISEENWCKYWSK